MEDVMRIKLVRNTFVEGNSLSSGDEIDVKEAVGKSLVMMHKAIEIPPTQPPPATQGEVQRIVVDANDGVTQAELSEAARVLREANRAALTETAAPKKASAKHKKG
jgi:hypothetical protein